MDSVLGVQYDGGVILAADQTNAAYGVLVYQTNLDKIAKLSSNSIMAVSGPNCDVVNFTQYIEKNFELYKLRTNEIDSKLSTKAQANFCRKELATALRRGPFQCNVLLGGYDNSSKDNNSSGQAELYWLDYLGTLQKVPYGCQGVATNFCLSIMDRDYTTPTSMTEEAAIAIIEKCTAELQIRFLPNQPNFIMKKVDKDGVHIIKFGKDPDDN